MKKIVLFLFLIVAFSACKKEKTTDSESETTENSSEWGDFGLNGKVKSTFEYTTETEQKEQTGNRKFETLFKPDTNYRFDELGKLIQKTTLNEDGSIAEEIMYDGKTKILSSKTFINKNQFSSIKYTWEGDINTIITRKNPDGSQLEKEVFQYDKGLKINRLKFNMHDAQSDKTTYSYDADNRLSEEKRFRDKPTIQSSLAIEYDENGDKSTEASYDKDYKLIWKTAFTYNNHLLTNSKTYTTDGTLEYELFNTFDKQNRLIAKGTFETIDNTKSKETFEYDEKNNITLCAIYKNEKIVSTTIYEYDNNNNLTAETVYDAAKKLVFQKTYQYTYDTNFNWITKKVTINNTKTFFTSRKIEYHK